MSSLQLGFTLRTSPNCKTVHLIGSWDGYKGQIPLSKDASKAGAWKGTFRFQGSSLKPGSRYWYYYLMDGYQTTHDPSKPFTVEPTTSRKLNILDVSPSSSSSKKTSSSSSSHSRRTSRDIPKGRPISPSRIKHPQPKKPSDTVDNLTRSLARARIREESDSDFDSDSDSGSDVTSDSGSDVPSLTSSRSSACSSPRTPSSAVSRSSSASSSCSCKRFGITRKGERVKIDCKGARCGGGSGEESCGSSSDEDPARRASTRRQGVVIRERRG